MIISSDFIIKNKNKHYRCLCDFCGKNRGYHLKSRSDKLCRECCQLSKHEDKLHSIKSIAIRQDRIILNNSYIGENTQLRIKCNKCKKIITTKAENFNRGAECKCIANYKRGSSNRGKQLVDPVIKKLKQRLRSRLNCALNNNQKSGSAVSDLGCTTEELKKYLESKWQTGMSWENHSLHGWHIDHIRPLASFNLEDKLEFLKACHYSNLQPLWAKDNLSKGKKYNNLSKNNRYRS